MKRGWFTSILMMIGDILRKPSRLWKCDHRTIDRVGHCAICGKFIPDRSRWNTTTDNVIDLDKGDHAH